MDFEIWIYLACLHEAPPPEALRRSGTSVKAVSWDLKFYYDGIRKYG